MCCFLPKEEPSSPRPVMLGGRRGPAGPSPPGARPVAAAASRVPALLWWWSATKMQEMSSPALRCGAVTARVSTQLVRLCPGDRVSTITLRPFCSFCVAWYERWCRTPNFSAGNGSEMPVKVCHCLKWSVTKTVESALEAALSATLSKRSHGTTRCPLGDEVIGSKRVPGDHSIL